MGGGVSWELAAQHPQNIESITAGSPVGWPLQRSLYRWLIEFIKMVHQNSQVPKEVRLKDPGPHLFLKRFRKDPWSILWGLKLASNADLRDRLPLVSSPVDLLWGRKDQYIPIKSGQQMQKLLPNASFTVVSDYNHLWYNLEPQKLTDPALKRIRNNRS